MKVKTQETLYHEDHGATLKHKCGKRIVAVSILSFSLIIFFSFFIWAFSLFLVGFFGLSFCGILWPLLFFLKFGVSSRLVGESQSPSSFPHWDNALIMCIITLLFTNNSRITTQNLEHNMTLCECLRRCTGICNESRVTCMKEL